MMKKCKKLIYEVRQSDADITVINEGGNLLKMIDFTNPTSSIPSLLNLNYLSRDPMIDIIPGDLTLDIQNNQHVTGKETKSINHVN